MSLDYIALAKAARQDTTLLPNHRNHVVPALQRRIAEIRGLIVTLNASRCNDASLIAEFEADLKPLLAVERFYATAKVKPGAKPRYQPNYVAYAKAHGRTPTAQMAHDEKRWHGGVMCGFILWMAQMRRLFFVKCPRAFMDQFTISDLAGWGKFLRTEGVPLSPA